MAQNFHIEIARPCRAGWENMEEAESGRFCNECSKIVIDFTQMSTDEIKSYFLNHKDQKICGHFISSQVIRGNKFQRSLVNLYERSEKISYRLPRIAAIVILSALMTAAGCKSDHTEGDGVQVDGGAMLMVDSTGIQNMDSLNSYANTPIDSLNKYHRGK
ncbi:MAG: hypothetical protein ACJ77K_16640 [Bacteroidia bacterium]